MAPELPLGYVGPRLTDRSARGRLPAAVLGIDGYLAAPTRASGVRHVSCTTAYLSVNTPDDDQMPRGVPPHAA